MFHPRRSVWRQGCAVLAALGLFTVSSGLALLWMLCGLSGWTFALVLGMELVTAGLAALVKHRRSARYLVAAGAFAILAPWLWRATFVRGSERARLTTLPGDHGARWADTLYPEADGSLAAAAFIGLSGGLRDIEAGQFSEILRQAYARAEADMASVPTPAIATYLGLQAPSAFDTIVIAPARPGAAPPSAALVFLHGFAGNFYVYCWEAAQAAAAANLLTLCPSVDASGAWWTAPGDATITKTLEYARGLGVKRIYLAGLSNGGAGASVYGLQHPRDLAGLILISGTRAERPPALPVLVVQGSLDRMMPASYARAYAARSGRAGYHEVQGGHLVFLSRYEKIRPVIAEFLSDLERTAAR